MVDKDLNPQDYAHGRDRYIRFAEDFLDLRLSTAQKKVLRTVAENQRTLVWGANGPGKSFITAVIKLAFLFTNVNSIVLGTSGSYQQYHDTMWRPLESLFKTLQSNTVVPGRTKGGKQPSLEINDEWYAKVVSPRSPGELEGRHGPNVMVIIDEADKKYVEDEHFESAGSSISDASDKMVAVCNPPKDETNVVYRKKHDPRWTVIEISSFEAHNVLIDAGKLDDEPIQGITDLITVAGDWEAWNKSHWPEVESSYGEDWPGMPTIQNKLEKGEVSRDQVCEWLAPGFDSARKAHLRRNDLAENWYIRRAGVIPPEGAEVHRPIYTDDVRKATDRSIDFEDSRYSIGIDIGRTTDKTAIVEVRRVEGDEETFGLNVRTNVGGKRSHSDNESMCRAAFENGPLLGQTAVDAMGEGSGVAEQMSKEYGHCMRFDAGMNPVDPVQKKTYKDRRSEALAALGEFLRDGNKIRDKDLEEELFASARIAQYNRRRARGHDVYKVTSKDEIKKQLGRSPDILDAAAIAIWAFKGLHERKMREVTDEERKSISSSW